MNSGRQFFYCASFEHSFGLSIPEFYYKIALNELYLCSNMMEIFIENDSTPKLWEKGAIQTKNSTLTGSRFCLKKCLFFPLLHITFVLSSIFPFIFAQNLSFPVSLDVVVKSSSQVKLF